VSSPRGSARLAEDRRRSISVGEHVLALLDGNFSRGLAGFSEDIVWHVAGGGEMGGEHRGREAVLALIGRLLVSPETRASISFRSLNEHEGYHFEWMEICADGESSATAYPIVSRTEAGRIREVWWCGRDISSF